MIRPLAILAVIMSIQAPPEWRPSFERHQPELFAATGGNTNAWADVDGDDDLDYFVGFRGRSSRFHRNDKGTFVEVGSAVGLIDNREGSSPQEVRAAAWGDVVADGDPDLYIGFADPGVPSKVYRNDGKGTRFVDVAAGIGLALKGVSRQPAWIDYDGDCDLDFFAAFRDGPNRLFRNDRGTFVDVTTASGVGDTRRTVGGVWWDFDRDGDLDLFVANQEGDANGLYRQTSGRFEDVAVPMGVAGTPRPKADGGVGPSLADVDLDGDFDLFVANYGPSALYRNEAGKAFVDRARDSGIDLRGHGVTSAWGDADNDGRPDLYVGNFIAGQPLYRDAFLVNGAARFVEALPNAILAHDATHGVRFVDFDRDGRLDLSLTNNDPAGGGHALWRNTSVMRGRSIAIDVVDGNARRTRAGAEVRAYRTGTRELLSADVVDSGSGYCSQSEMPVHLGIPASWKSRIDIEIITIAGGARHASLVRSIAPEEYRGRALRIITTQ